MKTIAPLALLLVSLSVATARPDLVVVRTGTPAGFARFGASARPVDAQRTARAQTGTDLFLVHITDRGGTVVVDSVQRLIARPGYDNQPHVLPDGRTVLYTSIDEAGQADIHRIDTRTGASERVTRTSPESEYSATLMPGGDRFSAIRVEADSMQRLWSFRLDGTDPRVLLERIEPVGYHAWIDGERVAVFVLGEPATLRIASVRTGEASVVAESIGRSLHRIPNGEHISFVHREGDDRVGWIKRYDPATGTITPLVRPFAGNEYHAWTPDGTLLTGSGSVLYAWWPGGGNEWVEIADLASNGVRGISRIAVSPDGRSLVLVAED